MENVKKYQLIAIQHTMRCIRGCIDTLWEILYSLESFSDKKDLIKQVHLMQQTAKQLEHKTYNLISSNKDRGS